MASEVPKGPCLLVNLWKQSKFQLILPVGYLGQYINKKHMDRMEKSRRVTYTAKLSNQMKKATTFYVDILSDCSISEFSNTHIIHILKWPY